MMNESMILGRLKRELGDDVFDAMPRKWFMDIILEESLYTWSNFYPKQVRGILIQPRDGIRAVHPQTMKECIYMFKIPKMHKDIVYTSIEQYSYSGNTQMNQMTSQLPLLNAAMSMVAQATPGQQFYNKIRFTVDFQPPDIAIVDPPPPAPVPFWVTMNAICSIYEVPLYYREYFLQLCVADIKCALLAKFKNLIDGESYQGLTVKNVINEFSDAKSERKELIEIFQKDFYKDARRFGTIFQYATNVVK